MLFALFVPHAEANYSEKVAVWVPWFQWEKGVESTENQLDEIDTVHLFIYEIADNGDIAARIDTESRDFRNFVRKLERKNIEIIPTIAWFDGEAIHETLSDKKARRALVRDIAEFVDDNSFDGVDIDFEGKKAATIDYFSTFLKELEDELGRDDLICTIEARTPADSLYRDVPEDIRYANDYEKINRYCDRVQIMAYDQQRADLKLNDKRRGVPYAPVADVDWVKKVIDLALEDIDKDKIMLGVPTYGRAWDVTVAPEWYRDYKRVATLNQPRILELSEKYESPIGRSAGGEPIISYFPEDSIYKILNALPVPENTPEGFEAAAKALFFATRTGMEVPVRFVTWSDADAIEDKLDLIEKYDLRGVSVFKVDGEEDPDIWDLF